MKDKKYNWWDDPKNRDEVMRLSWWEHAENKIYFDLPISVAESDGVWVATCNKETKKYLGDRLSACAQGSTKEEAIKEMFSLIKMQHDFTHERMLSYERWVPFRKGNWGHIGGTWFAIFGIHFYFRYGKGMIGGKYIPFTKLNISISNTWITYKTTP